MYKNFLSILRKIRTIFLKSKYLQVIANYYYTFFTDHKLCIEKFFQYLYYLPRLYWTNIPKRREFPMLKCLVNDEPMHEYITK